METFFGSVVDLIYIKQEKYVLPENVPGNPKLLHFMVVHLLKSWLIINYFSTFSIVWESFVIDKF